ncbi:uncharacterized protein LOC121770381 [Salvia splendens]|uniref:uncharacterized protein LOC121770381 n=1 Tax=Salvia splendens TaxID=180675 RepID=UPI001C26D275|nr:uncharacterized protein LOC121770381 [Salvia splendens]
MDELRLKSKEVGKKGDGSYTSLPVMACVCMDWNVGEVTIRVVPACSEQLKPLVGQRFESLEFALAFYDVYARAVGFDTREQGVMKVDEVTTWYYVVCNREDHKKSIDDDQLNARSDLNIPEFPIELKPFVGRSFPTLDNVIEFYENYGRRVGFDTRKNESKKVDDITIWFYMVCNREGEQKFNDQQPKRRRKSKKCGCNASIAFKFDSDRGYVIQHFNKEHNHPMVAVQHHKFMRLNRQLEPIHQKFISDCAGANIGPSLTFKLLTGLMGGYESVGCTVLDIRNYTRDIRRYAEGCDAQMIIDELKKKKENCDAFTYEYEVDSRSHLIHLFWCDPIAKMNFLQFCDIVSFYTTYSTNRWCMWHIMAKVAEKVPKSLLGNTDFKKDLNLCIWSELIEPTEFEDKWKNVMETFDLIGSECNAVDAQRNYSAKLDYMDYNTTAKMKTKWSIEKHGSTIFTDGAFKEIQEQIMEAYNHCSLVSISNDSSPEVYKVLDHFSNTWSVTLSVEDSVCVCGCKMFSRTALVCCHIFLVLKKKKFRLIPEYMIGGRWLKSSLLKGVHGVQNSDVATHVYVDEKKKAQAILLGEMWVFTKWCLLILIKSMS